MKKFTLALIAITSINFASATSLVRRAAKSLVSNRVTKTMVKPVNWITQTHFYKKHPWFVKGVGVITAGLVTREVYKRYKKYTKQRKFNREQELIDAAATGNRDKVQQFLAQGVNVNAQDAQGNTALMHAVYDGKVEAAKALIQAGAKVNEKNKIGQTALMHATNLLPVPAHLAPLELTKMLIEAGADIDAKDTEGKTALWYACYRNNFNCVAALLLSGAEIDNQTEQILNTSGVSQEDKLQAVHATQSYMRSRAQIPPNMSEPYMNIIADFLLGEKDQVAPCGNTGTPPTWSPPNNDWSTVTPHMTKQPEFNFWETSEQVESKRNHAQAHSDAPGLS